MGPIIGPILVTKGPENSVSTMTHETALHAIISLVIQGTLITFLYALAALGLAVVFGLIGVINMAHGAMITLGAYFTWACLSAGFPFVLAVMVAVLGVGLVGLIVEHVLIRHFYDKPFETLLLTWGLFLILTELIKIAFGSDIRTIPTPLPDAVNILGFHIPEYEAVVALLSAVLLGLTGLVFYKTSYGIKIRALTQNREVAGLLGLNVAATYKVAFVAGAMLAGLAGALMAPLLSIDPTIGNIYLVRSFFVVIVGGIGQLLGGTLAGSFLIGGSQTIFAAFSSQVIAQTVVFALAIVVLRFRPTGVFKEK
ncbi:branched-chain amino acid ABC transporter permease [Acidiphilium sp.]|uniref:branched-chain amino acid ABC transporter permease n=2 Tax=unclassified Acidiphilium TaxID=2617493 RepID=UPI00258EB50D|nr:branched-chain amino acid ABC transporter permease [Acidiphilium sp.]